jgi:hypothetical protein
MAVFFAVSTETQSVLPRVSIMPVPKAPSLRNTKKVEKYAQDTHTETEGRGGELVQPCSDHMQGQIFFPDR